MLIKQEGDGVRMGFYGDEGVLRDFINKIWVDKVGFLLKEVNISDGGVELEGRLLGYGGGGTNEEVLWEEENGLFKRQRVFEEAVVEENILERPKRVRLAGWFERGREKVYMLNMEGVEDVLYGVEGNVFEEDGIELREGGVVWDRERGEEYALEEENGSEEGSILVSTKKLG